MQRKPDGSLIGHKGVQYGLIKPTGPAKKAALVAPRPPNIFGDDDSDDDVEAQVARQADKKRSAAKVDALENPLLSYLPTCENTAVTTMHTCFCCVIHRCSNSMKQR